MSRAFLKNLVDWAQMRDTIFIGHAAPQDNEFSIWLYSKLEMEGYEVWCDLQSLYGGEKDFWENIQKIIAKEACKYLLVFSKHTFKKDGVKDEYEFARGIARKFGLEDFVIPLRIGKVDYEERIGINRYNVIDFSDSWLPGLKRLLLKLTKDKVQKDKNKTPSISDWILNSYLKAKGGLVKKKEIYYSSWWPINKLPEKMYLFQYSAEGLARAILEEGASYPIVRHGNYLASFENQIKKINKTHNNLEINPIAIKDVATSNILEGYESHEFPTLIDSQNLLKRLLFKAFKDLMYEKELRIKEMANNQLCFFYPKGVLYNNQAIVKYHNRKKKKNLVGKYYKKFWHFGVSARVRLSPFVYFSLKSHILFSDNGYRIWDSDSRLHAARRSKGKRWFNEQWRDQLMAFISSLARGEEKILMKLAESFNLEMPLLTRHFYSNVGYHEPETKERLGILHESGESFYYLAESGYDSEDEPKELGVVTDD